MIQSVNKVPLHQLFSPDSNVRYIIPKYQRGYSWGKKQLEDIYKDIYEENDNEEGPFLGSIICVSRTHETLLNPRLEIIDGQQRLTTISLLYIAIYSKLITESKSTSYEIENLRYRLIQKSRPKETKLELSYQDNNFEDYKEILEQSQMFESKEGKPKNLGNRRLYRAFSLFSEKLENMKIEDVKLLLNKINSSLIIMIEVNSNADAFNLFESINNRGMRLSAIDLIKNNLLATLEKKESKPISEAFEEWKTILENLTEDPKIHERFLRHFYNAFKHDEKIKVKIREGKATKSNLIDIYDKLINERKDGASLLLKDLFNKSVIYKRFIDSENDNEEYKEIIDILHIGGTPSYAFLLYLLTEFKDKKELIKKTISFLSKYFVRRNLTDYPATRNLDNIFIGLIEECERNKKNVNFELIKNFLINPERYAGNDLFKEKLEGDIYDTNPEVTRYILCKIEEPHLSKEDKNLWERDKKDKYIFTIEHIFPEGEKIKEAWVDMIANGDKLEAKRLQKMYVHKLGNLTLTGYNSNLSDLPFDKKRDRKDKKGAWIGYKNKLYLNNEIYPLSKKDKWTVEDIEKRTQILIKEALKLFN